MLCVLKMFSLTVPPVGMMAPATLGCEHVFGLSYVVGKRPGPRLKRAARVAIAHALAGIALFTALLTTCGGTASVCPPVRLGERPPDLGVHCRLVARDAAGRAALSLFDSAT